MEHKQSRRQFLQGSALATASLPILDGMGLLAHLLPSAQAATATGVAPLRLILISSPFQNPEVFFHPHVSATNTAEAPAGSNFYLGFTNSILAPLAPFQSDLIIFRGLAYGFDDTSHNSTPFTFSGSKVAQGSSTMDPTTKGTTIEHYLFNRMAQAGSLTPISCGPFSYIYNNNFYCYSFNNGTHVGPTGNPKDLYNNLFGNFKSGSGTANPLFARRQAIQNLVQKYLTGLKDQLSQASTSQTVLQSHLAASQGLVAQLGSSQGGGGASCLPPSLSTIANDTGCDDGGFSYKNGDLDFQSFTNLIVQAFACDITRFANFKFSDQQDNMNELIRAIPALAGSSYINNWHDGITHQCTGKVTDPLTISLAQYKNYFMTKVANLLSALKGVSDPYNPSQTLYDNTVVLIGSEGPISYGQYDSHGDGFGFGGSDPAFVLAGGCGGYFKKGQLFFAGGSTKPSVYHNALLANIVNIFEKNQQQFNPAYTPNYVSSYGDFPFSVSATSWLA